MPPYTEFITVLEIKRASLERDFQHRTFVYGGINTHTDSLQFSCDGVKHFFDMTTNLHIYEHYYKLLLQLSSVYLWWRGCWGDVKITECKLTVWVLYAAVYKRAGRKSSFKRSAFAFPPRNKLCI